MPTNRLSKHPMSGKRRKCVSCSKRRIMTASIDEQRTQWVCEECRIYHMMSIVGSHVRRNG